MIATSFRSGFLVCMVVIVFPAPAELCPAQFTDSLTEYSVARSIGPSAFTAPVSTM